MSAKPKIIMSPLLAFSVTNQADMIKTLIMNKGYDVEYKTTVSVQDIQNPNNKAFLWFTLATCRFIGGAVAPYIYLSGRWAKPKAVYVTVEGIPTKANTLCSNIPKLDLIANSHFTKDSLLRSGMKVIDVVHHAVDIKACEKYKVDSDDLRKKWESETGDRCKLIYVGRNDPRKGIDNLTKAVEIANKSMENEYILFIFSEGNFNELEKQNNVRIIGSCGSLPHAQVLRMMGASDYIIFPSICEGFGLPVLEGNAMGKPVIHSWFPPLSEFSSKDFNFVFGYQEEVLVNQGNLQYWRFHQYRPQLLAEIIMDAVRIYRDSRSEYDEYCAKAVDHAKKWDYRKIYPKLLKHIKV